MSQNRKQLMEQRLNLFINIIQLQRAKEENKIRQRGQIQQAEARNKIMESNVQLQKDNHSKRLKSLQVEARIYKSTKINQSRMAKMNVRHQLIQQLKSNLKVNLQKVISDPNLYAKLLKKLIIQALIKLMEPEIQVKCLKRDINIVKSLMQEAENEFNEISINQTSLKTRTKLTLNQNQCLDSEFKQLLGGVVLTSLKGRIVCINTLDARLNYCLQDMLPSIRKNLFDRNA